MGTETMTVWGVVNADGSIGNGTGFSITHQDGGGEYIISFSPSFSGMPAISGSQVNFGSQNENTRDGVVFPFLNGGAATALTGDGGGSKTDRSFAFIAVGPA